MERPPSQAIAGLPQDLPRFEGALVTSTSRLALPVDFIEVPDDSSIPTKQFGASPLARRIEALVLAAIERSSGRVL